MAQGIHEDNQAKSNVCVALESRHFLHFHLFRTLGEFRVELGRAGLHRHMWVVCPDRLAQSQSESTSLLKHTVCSQHFNPPGYISRITSTMEWRRGNNLRAQKATSALSEAEKRYMHSRPGHQNPQKNLQQQQQLHQLLYNWFTLYHPKENTLLCVEVSGSNILADWHARGPTVIGRSVATPDGHGPFGIQYSPFGKEGR